MTGRRRRSTGVFACNHRTLQRRICRHPGRWLIPGDKRFYCWQHACNLVRDRGLAHEVTHVITGERRRPTIRPLAIDKRPLPTTVDGIVAEFDRARNVAAFNRGRRACIAQIRHVKDERLGLKTEVLQAIHAARARIGLPLGGTR